jgi:hypothetical protein
MLRIILWEDVIISYGDYIQLYTINIPNRFYL